MLHVPTLLILILSGGGPATDLPARIETLRAVEREGRGNAEATLAWRELVKADASALPEILSGLDGARPLAANWIRAAADAVAERELGRGGRLPAERLEEFLLDTKHDPRARRLAFEWLSRVDATAPDRLVPKLSDDPSVELRRDAVGRILESASALLEKKEVSEATLAFEKALARARDLDQIREASKKLKELGRQIDLPRHLGFLTDWKLVGPFDHTGSKAFHVAYPPEEKVDSTAEHDGKEGKVRWRDFSTKDDFGLVDLNVALGPHKGAIAYALADFHAERRQKAEIRLGTMNAFKLWLNGKLIFWSEEYHRGMELDQFRLQVELEEGSNLILLKLCQNEQTEDWAQRWEFQLRVCDAAGTAILSKPEGRPASAGDRKEKP